MLLSEKIRQAIQEIQATEGLSLNELGRRCGVSAAQLSRFLHGARSLTLPAADKVCDYLGLTLSKMEQPAPVKKKTPRRRTS